MLQTCKYVCIAQNYSLTQVASNSERQVNAKYIPCHRVLMPIDLPLPCTIANGSQCQPVLMPICTITMQRPICWRKVGTRAECTGKIWLSSWSWSTIPTILTTTTIPTTPTILTTTQNYNTNHAQHTHPYHHNYHPCISISASSALHQRQCITISASLSLHRHHQYIIISASSLNHHYHCIVIISASVVRGCGWLKHSDFFGLMVWQWWFIELYSCSRFLARVHDGQRCSKMSSQT